MLPERNPEQFSPLFERPLPAINYPQSRPWLERHGLVYSVEELADRFALERETLSAHLYNRLRGPIDELKSANSSSLLGHTADYEYAFIGAKNDKNVGIIIIETHIQAAQPAYRWIKALHVLSPGYISQQRFSVVMDTQHESLFDYVGKTARRFQHNWRTDTADIFDSLAAIDTSHDELHTISPIWDATQTLNQLNDIPWGRVISA